MSKILNFKNLPLHFRYFLGMLVILLIAMFATTLISFYQFKSIQKNYNKVQLEHKETILIKILDYLINFDENNIERPNSDLSVQIDIISDINDIPINVYDLKGRLIARSHTSLMGKPSFTSRKQLSESIMKELKVKHRLEVKNHINANYYTSVYCYFYKDHEPVAIINLPYLKENKFMTGNFYTLLYRYMAIIFSLLILSGVLAWILSKTLTSKITEISHKLEKTQILSFAPIEYNYEDEISPLVNSYNSVLKKMEEQARLLAKKERDEAWKEMAKQVAHEIKNPLTPMKLELQNFQMRYKKEDKNNPEKIKQLTDSLMIQIDTISSIAEAFSNFANMPTKLDKKIDIVKNTKKILDIFSNISIKFNYSDPEIFLSIDPTYFNRILTNLIKNAIQAKFKDRILELKISLYQDNEFAYFSIEDNGEGIPEEIKSKIFLPQFTTKTSGSGLGLALIKRIIEEYNGSIEFESKVNKGSMFKFKIQK